MARRRRQAQGGQRPAPAAQPRGFSGSACALFAIRRSTIPAASSVAGAAVAAPLAGIRNSCRASRPAAVFATTRHRCVRRAMLVSVGGMRRVRIHVQIDALAVGTLRRPVATGSSAEPPGSARHSGADVAHRAPPSLPPRSVRPSRSSPGRHVGAADQSGSPGQQHTARGQAVPYSSSAAPASARSRRSACGAGVRPQAQRRQQRGDQRGQ